ncbi:uncharacterized protein BKA78DRAFT_300702 [Phyllosticta capitalensis]|uniref:uncharacterized protein n=1 Tax=Phyllosticta capitalensis TaxID=121624 RepID=UPI00312E0904
MANNAFPTRPLKKPRLHKESQTTLNYASINDAVEPPLPYVPSHDVRPIKPTLADRCPIDGMKTTIVSRRYRNKCGDPIFTVRLERLHPKDDDDLPAVKEKEIGFEDIEDYVSKAELERFETTWYDPDEVMPGIVIGAPGFEKTQTWEGPSTTTSTSDEGSGRSSKRTKKVPTREFVDMLPPIRRPGRPPKKTAAVMGVGPAPAVNSHDGHQSEEEAYDFDADIEDEVDPANVRGTGGFVLIPSSRSASASSQVKAGASVGDPVRKLPVVSEHSSSASEDGSSASEDEEPDELLMGFNPHRTKDQDHRAPTSASSVNRRGRGPRPSRAGKSTEPRSGSLLAYVESNHIATNPAIRKSPTHKPTSPTHANILAEKAAQEGEGEGEEEEDAVLPDAMPVTYESIERDEDPTNNDPLPAPAPAAEAEGQAPPKRPVEIIEISSDSESELSPSSTPNQKQLADLSPARRQRMAELEREGEQLQIERAAMEARRAEIMRAREEEHRRNFQAEEEQKNILRAQEEREQIRLAEEYERRAAQQHLPAPGSSPPTFTATIRPSPKAVRSPTTIRRRGSSGAARSPTLRRRGSSGAARSPTAIRRSFLHSARPHMQHAQGTSADNAICLDDDEDDTQGNNIGDGAGGNPQDGTVPDEYYDDSTNDDDNSSITDSVRGFSYSSVIDHKKEDGVFVYLVKWDEKPHPPEDESWFPEDEMGHGAKQIIDNYLRELRKPSSPNTLRNPTIEYTVRPRWRLMQEREKARKAQEKRRARMERERERQMASGRVG